jgi:hypothetical protein
MTKFFFLLFTVGLIMESTLVPFPITFLFFLTLYRFFEEKGEFWAFFLGLSLDMFIPRMWGVDSLIFLTAMMILRRYKRKINFQQTVFEIVFVILSLSIYTWFFYKYSYVEIYVAIAAVTTLVIYFVRKFWGEKKTGSKLFV